MTTHTLKCWPEYFQPLFDGIKPFEVRFNDRHFMTGDILVIKEWDDRKAIFTGREVKRAVTYVLRGVPGGVPPLAGLQRNYVVLGLAPL